VSAYSVRLWKRTIGRRRAQSEILDQICCTSSLAFVESKIGVPQFIMHDGGYEQRFYRLPGAWVTIEPVNEAVRAFTITITITITDPSMYYETRGMTFGLVDLRLGKDTFAKAQRGDDEQFAIGARHSTYVRHYVSNNPNGFQEYWLAYSMIGAGTVGGEPYASGDYAAKYTEESKRGDGTFGTPLYPRGSRQTR
jgi:hypothetical protein